MVIGVPREIKKHEYRIGLAPAGARELIEAGHTVLVQGGAGEGSGIGDGEFRQAGARLVDDAEEVYAEAETIVKVKEPLSSEYDLLRQGQILFTFLHLAPARKLTRALLDRGVTGVAYETVQLDNGSLPLLQPMSEVAGRMSVQAGAHFLQKENGGRGVLLSGVPGVRRGKVVIIGGGTVGSNALRIAVGMGADVTVLDTKPSVLGNLEDRFSNRIRTLISNPRNIEDEVASADLVIGAVLVPRLIEALQERRTMAAGAVLHAMLGFAIVLPLGYAGYMALWVGFGLAASLVLTPGGLVIARSAARANRAAVFAAQFSLSHAGWMVAYPLAGELGARVGLETALMILSGLTIGMVILALRAWPSTDPLTREHEHPELPADHRHLREIPAHGQRQRHAHAFHIDDLHPKWGNPSNIFVNEPMTYRKMK